MIRAFENEKRVATAVFLKDGTLLQVYPSKKKFENEDLWKDQFSCCSFKTESREVNRDAEPKAKANTKIEEHVKECLSLPVPSDTPIQALIRQIFNQYGIPDNLTVKRKNPGIWRTKGRDSILYVYCPTQKSFGGVFFNRRTGMYMIGKLLRPEIETEGLVFFFKKPWSADFLPVDLHSQTLQSGQKVVVYIPGTYRYEHDIALQKKLLENGFHILFYNDKRRPSKEILEELYKIPNLKGVILESGYPGYKEGCATFMPHPSEIKITYYPSYVNPVTKNLAEWFQQNQ